MDQQNLRPHICTRSMILHGRNCGSGFSPSNKGLQVEGSPSKVKALGLTEMVSRHPKPKPNPRDKGVKRYHLDTLYLVPSSDAFPCCVAV